MAVENDGSAQTASWNMFSSASDKQWRKSILNVDGNVAFTCQGPGCDLTV